MFRKQFEGWKTLLLHWLHFVSDFVCDFKLLYGFHPSSIWGWWSRLHTYELVHTALVLGKLSSNFVSSTFIVSSFVTLVFFTNSLIIFMPFSWLILWFCEFCKQFNSGRWLLVFLTPNAFSSMLTQVKEANILCNVLSSYTFNYQLMGVMIKFISCTFAATKYEEKDYWGINHSCRITFIWSWALT